MNDSPTYSVITSGRIKDGFELARVREDFARLFKLSPQKAQAFVGTKRSVKKNIDLRTAQKYQKSLSEIGLDVAIKKHRPSPAPISLALEPIEEEEKSTWADSETNDIKGKGTITCPKCNLTQNATDQCAGCGVYIHKVQTTGTTVESNKIQLDQEQSLQATESPPLNLIALVAAGFTAFIGAILWKYIALSTGYELGAIAWLIGGAIGFIAAIMGSNGQTQGVICGVFALLAILGGKYMVMQSYQGNILEVLAEAGMQTEELRPIYEEELANAKVYQNTVTNDASMRQFMVDYDYSEAYEVADVTDEERNYFEQYYRPRLEQMAIAPPSFDQWLETDFQQDFENVSTLELIKEDFGLIDLVFLLLGVGTAFRLGSGELGGAQV